jgi:O-antigen/teichoic acid export membrane protein
VLFPAFAATAVTDRARLRMLYLRGLRYLLTVLFPVLLLAELFGADALAVWVGGSFAEQSGDVVRRLSVGVLFSSLALIPFTLLQGVGRPRVPAIVQLVEVPLYAIALWLVVPVTGIQGAAALWSGRVVVEALAFLLFADAYLTSSGRDVIRNLAIVTLPLAIMLLGQLPSATTVRVGFAIVALVVFAPFTWFVLLSDAERSLLRRSRGLFPLTRDAG